MSVCQRCGSQEAVILPNNWGTFCISCLEKSKLCDGCGKIHLTTDVCVVGDQILCRSCAGNAANCSKCGSLHAGGLLHRGKQYCPKCAADFVTCEVCGKIHSKNTISELDRLRYGLKGFVCNPCFEAVKASKEPLPVFECKRCGKIHCHVTEYEDTPCEKHAPHYVLCVCCGKTRHLIYGQNQNDFHIGVCEHCGEHKQLLWRYCSACSTYHKTSDMVGRLCKPCAATRFECPICRDMRDKRTAIELEGTLICEHCHKKCKCQKCGVTTLGTEGGYCYACCDKHKIIRVNSYSFKPHFKLFGNGIHLGVENEIAFVNDDEKKILASVPRSWMFMKSDSSVECGVECVFHPTTLAYFQENKHILDTSFSSGNLKPHKSAGMHVHMTKDKFGTYQLFKFIQFFKDHTTFIEKVAGRKANHYAQHIDGRPTEIALDAKKNESGAERYRSINISNEHTIEVRIFAGVTDAKNFMKNIEFCDALYNFTKTSPHFKKGQIALDYFLKYVEAHKHTYPHLHIFLGGAPPREVPEKYRKSSNPLTTFTELHEELLESLEETPQHGLFEGCRVILTSNEWSGDRYNPVHGTQHACEGTLATYSTCEWGCVVLWDNGNSNNYSIRHLTTVR